MREGGTLIKEGTRWFLKDGKRYEVASSIKLDSDFHEASVEKFDLDSAGKVVIWFTAWDMDDNLVEFKATPQGGGAAHVGRGEQRKPQDRNPVSFPVGQAPAGAKPQIVISKADKERLREINKKRKDNPARAPYNFIPLNSKIATVPAPTNGDTFHKELYSGYLVIEIENQTPFFIRKEKGVQDFFSMGSGPFIPGASIRGLIRSMLEIMTWSELDKEMYSNRRLAFRSLADMCFQLRAVYKDAMPNSLDSKSFKGGYLQYDANDDAYFIVPAEVKQITSSEQAQYPQKEADGYKVFTGRLPNKKKQWLFGAPRLGVVKKLDKDLIDAYRDDRTRKSPPIVNKKALDLLEETKKNGHKWPNGYPVFYVEVNDRVASFGHTGFYRLPYRHLIGDHVIQEPVAEKEQVDFAKAIFGTTQRAGRVWFEDGYPTTDRLPFVPAQRTAQLMEPKATTFQHYLEQKPDSFKTDLEKLEHWGDSGVPIRGFKQYWHRGTSPSGSNADLTWGYKGKASDESPSDYDQAPIKPLLPGAKFIARIRFDNLSSVELGALFTAIELPQECCHKLGLGKPLGLGTIRITVKACEMIDRSERYTKLFSGQSNAWNEARHALNDPEKVQVAFVQYLGKQIQHPMPDLKAFWAEPRMAALHAMLHWDKGLHSSRAWLEETRYMEIERKEKPEDKKDNEYKDRPVLPLPHEVLDIFQNQKRPKK